VGLLENKVAVNIAVVPLFTPHPGTAATAATAASPSSSSTQPAATAAPRLTLSGGVPHHASLAALWRDDRLTDAAR